MLELRMTSLTEIMSGKVFFHNNNLLCYENQINWRDIQPRVQPPVKHRFNSDYYRRPCGECHPSCYNSVTQQSHCWGAGPDMCQHLSQGDVCSKTCDGRCFGSAHNQCCHPQCVAGCMGQENTECLACRLFSDDGKCVGKCPELQIYDQVLMKWVENPNPKYIYGSLCVSECPEHLIVDDGACVKTCADGKYVVNNTCVDCEGPCPLTCPGVGKDFVHSGNINRFKGCTIIEGNIRLLRNTFTGDLHELNPPIHANNLSVFETVKEITGFLTIQSNITGYTTLEFFKNLEIISGRNTDDHGNSLQVIRTNLKSLELVKLKTVKTGNVIIAANHQLCYADRINFNSLFSAPNFQKAIISGNRDSKACEREGAVCSPQCSTDGCWGTGQDKCLSCRNFRLAKTSVCLETCSENPMLYELGNQCWPCHSQCKDSCTGPESTDCVNCKNVQLRLSSDKMECMEKCPSMMYPDENNICQGCHHLCHKDSGCTGPSFEAVTGGCISCELGLKTFSDNRAPQVFCIEKEEGCPSTHYLTREPMNSQHPMAGKLLCLPCHELCKTCEGEGVAFCTSCVHYNDNSRCVKECRSFTYIDNSTRKCMECNDECRQGCVGPATTDCVACQNFKVYLNDSTGSFNCTPECPPDKPNVLTNNVDDQSFMFCAGDDHPQVLQLRSEAAEEEKKKILTIAVPVVGGVLLFGILLAVFGYHWRRRAIAKENTAKLTARMTGYDESEPLTPTDAKPDLAQLRLIKESELRRGGIIGSGAFGTVYKGFWIPDGENVKIPVAIKVLQEGTSPNQNKELLEEARVMASVNDPNCTKILAVCMTAQMMLISQLMPLGCLLDYVRKQKENISSKVFLNWCTQIAKGMCYLEDRGIVHRDLAARNVLVQSPYQVRITDFGLAKLLDYNEEQFQAAGGKMPIKWLALECIQHRIFTHKSDIWSYGVTVWELFTYGQRPYENIRARDVSDLLEKGERLPQPAICTIDVYMIMIKCWMLDADSRPSFRELTDEFSKMARDPGRYLVIQGDRLMRLPSHSIDKGDLIRSLSVAADGPEEVIEAEEYLQPQTRQTADNNNVPLLQAYPGGATNVYAKEKEAIAGPRREKRYGHLESAAAARQQREHSPSRLRGDSVNSRYSSDPIKFFKERDEVDGIGVPKQRIPSVSRSFSGGDKQGVHKAPKPLQLPVDEDDYLQPKSSNPRAYMDLIDGKDYYINEKTIEEEDENPSQYVPMDSPAPLQSVENPEYFDGETETAWEKHPVNDISFVGQKHKDSAYYNDIANLKDKTEANSLFLSGGPDSGTTV
ncbi:hypothetical protein ScPMuIL_017262 [Solemya velum]